MKMGDLKTLKDFTTAELKEHIENTEYSIDKCQRVLNDLYEKIHIYEYVINALKEKRARHQVTLEALKEELNERGRKANE